jgi:signal peptidase I
MTASAQLEAVPTPPNDTAAAGHRRSAARMTLSALWFVVIPALLAALVVRRLIPTIAIGPSAPVEDAVHLGQRQPLVLAVGLFLLFASAARYWRFFLPGWPYMAGLATPSGRRLTAAQRRVYADAMAFDRSLATARMRRRLQRALGSGPLEELHRHLADLRAGVNAWDEVRVRESSLAARALLAPALVGSQRRELVWGAVAIGLAAALGLGVRGRLVESYTVLSGSMLPTLELDDRLAGNRLAYRTWGRAGSRSPRRGDIVVFKSSAVDDGNLTEVPEFLVKRVIGLPGDRIAMRGGVPVINGWTVPNCDAGEYLYVLPGGENGLDGRLVVEFLEGRSYLTVYTMGSATFGDTYEVQPGEVFVLGDNRNNSIDSRAYNDHHGGGVPFEAIEARVQWFVAARGADKRWDFGRILRSVDSLATTIHLTGMDAGPLRSGIEKCLAKRPENTSPPAPSAAPPATNGAP